MVDVKYVNVRVHQDMDFTKEFDIPREIAEIYIGNRFTLEIAVSNDAKEKMFTDLDVVDGKIRMKVDRYMSRTMTNSKYKYSIIVQNDEQRTINKLYEGMLYLEWTPNHGGFNYG